MTSFELIKAKLSRDRLTETIELVLNDPTFTQEYYFFLVFFMSHNYSTKSYTFRTNGVKYLMWSLQDKITETVL